MPIYVVLMSVSLFLFALILFVGGYLVQFLACAGGTDPGEIIYFKRKLGMPYVEVARSQKPGGIAWKRSTDVGKGGARASRWVGH